jgi:hypothetical protein
LGIAVASVNPGLTLPESAGGGAGTTEGDEAQSSVLWLFFTTLVREAKWSDCVDRYEQAKLNVVPPALLPNTVKNQEQFVAQAHTFLDNAMLEVSLIYEEYEYAWGVYEQMKNGGDRHTVVVLMTIIWKAFFSVHKRSKSQSPMSSVDSVDDDDPSILRDQVCQIHFFLSYNFYFTLSIFNGFSCVDGKPVLGQFMDVFEHQQIEGG